MEVPIYYNEEEEWQRALLLYDAVLKEICTKIEILNNEFKLAHQYNPIEHISSRIKSADSIARKMRINNRELTVENIIRYINDVAGVRIICTFTSDIYRIADAIAKQSDVTVLRVKDYIANPKPNGYTSYHMIVSIPIFLSNDKIVAMLFTLRRTKNTNPAIKSTPARIGRISSTGISGDFSCPATKRISRTTPATRHPTTPQLIPRLEKYAVLQLIT